MIKKSRIRQRNRIKTRIIKKIRGTSARPRLTVYRSLHHVHAQIIDDASAKTLVAVSSLSKDIKNQLTSVKGQKEIAKRVGLALAKKAILMNLKQVVFDRNGYLYHGVVRSVADGAREGGLEL